MEGGQGPFKVTLRKAYFRRQIEFIAKGLPLAPILLCPCNWVMEQQQQKESFSLLHMFRNDICRWIRLWTIYIQKNLLVKMSSRLLPNICQIDRIIELRIFIDSYSVNGWVSLNDYFIICVSVRWKRNYRVEWKYIYNTFLSLYINTIYQWKRLKITKLYANSTFSKTTVWKLVFQ